MELLVLGVMAGVLTTIAGMGGGIFMLLAMSLLTSPVHALAATAPALLLGNLHRAVMFRRSVAPRVAGPFLLGAIPGSLIGGMTLAALPMWLVQGLMVTMTALALLRAAGVWRWDPPSTVLAPAGFGIGAVSATAGGAGLLVSPLLMATGLTGERYVATTAAVATGMHLGRIVAYGSTGLVDASVLRHAAVLTVAVVLGNTLGTRLRKVIPATWATRIELGVLLVSAAMSLAGLTR